MPVSHELIEVKYQTNIFSTARVLGHFISSLENIASVLLRYAWQASVPIKIYKNKEIL